jgi:putative transposase
VHTPTKTDPRYPECHAIVRGIWDRSATLDGWWVGNYVLMPDHVHFFARPETEACPMAKWIQMWKGVSSRRIAKALNLPRPIWQADYFDRYLRSTESYSKKWDYVEQNPVRAGLVERFEDWPYRGVIHDLML